MPLPYFYIDQAPLAGETQVLDPDTSRHIVQVLRMQSGEQMHLTNGTGSLALAQITGADKKHCSVQVLSSVQQDAPPRKCTIAVSLVKNAHRFEWFLEKATEIGVTEIVPLICSRTEKQHFRADRMKSILVGAMLQSQQAWLPILHEPVKMQVFVKALRPQAGEAKFIAHCEAGEPRNELAGYLPAARTTVLIGPEGDFTIDEIESALQQGFVPVALGRNRLRTETAALVALTIIAMRNSS